MLTDLNCDCIEQFGTVDRSQPRPWLLEGDSAALFAVALPVSAPSPGVFHGVVQKDNGHTECFSFNASLLSVFERRHRSQPFDSLVSCFEIIGVTDGTLSGGCPC
jgi:hypothetical protein